MLQAQVNFSNEKSLHGSTLERITKGVLNDTQEIFFFEGNSVRVLMSFINDLGLTSLAKDIIKCIKLGKWSNIKKLSLCFETCHAITDKGIEMFCLKLFTKCESLQELSLDLKGCSKLTNKSLETLFLYMSRHLFQLEKLTLNFSHCFRITDDLIKKFTERILKNMKRIKHVQIVNKKRETAVNKPLKIIEKEACKKPDFVSKDTEVWKKEEAVSST